MKIFINGKETLTDKKTVLDLIEHIGLKKEWTLVELNKKALERHLFDTTLLNEEDNLEIVRAVAGG